MAAAGISLFKSSDGYIVSVSLFSSSGGSTIGTGIEQVTSLSSLLETVKSLLRQWQESKIKAYLVSVPSAFPADEYYDALNTITEGSSHYYYDTDAPEPETTLAEDDPSVFITHGEAYCATLPHNSALPGFATIPPGSTNLPTHFSHSRTSRSCPDQIRARSFPLVKE